MSLAWTTSAVLRQPYRTITPSAFRVHLQKLTRGLHSSPRQHGSPSFTYKVAAAFSGKGNVFDRTKHHYAFDSSTGVGSYIEPTITSRGRRLPSGQDSFFISSVGDSSAAAFAVADGVGGYKDHGVDSADFAHGLTRYMRETAEACSGDQSSEERLTALQMLRQGYTKLCHDKSIKGGGSTACVAIANPDGTLNVANLGDSGYVHLRLNKIQHYSNPQTHAFNTPFQLSTVPPKILAQIENFGGQIPFHDMPKDASISTHNLKHGDVLCFATDGVWDNLTSQDILTQVGNVMTDNGAWTARNGQDFGTSEVLPWLTKHSSDGKASEWVPLHSQLAIDITQKAKATSVDTRREGPFARAMHKAYPMERWKGGKIDDICVVAVVVLEDGA